MKRAFTSADGGKNFRMNNPDSEFHGQVGQLEGFPLADPGAAEPDEGILWFGPEDNRDGWAYVKPEQVESRKD